MKPTAMVHGKVISALEGPNSPTPSGSGKAIRGRPVGGGHKNPAVAHGYSTPTPSGFREVPAPCRVQSEATRADHRHAKARYLYAFQSGHRKILARKTRIHDLAMQSLLAPRLSLGTVSERRTVTLRLASFRHVALAACAGGGACSMRAFAASSPRALHKASSCTPFRVALAHGEAQLSLANGCAGFGPRSVRPTKCP